MALLDLFSPFPRKIRKTENFFHYWPSSNSYIVCISDYGSEIHHPFLFWLISNRYYWNILIHPKVNFFILLTLIKYISLASFKMTSVSEIRHFQGFLFFFFFFSFFFLWSLSNSVIGIFYFIHPFSITWALKLAVRKFVFFCSPFSLI